MQGESTAKRSYMYCIYFIHYCAPDGTSRSQDDSFHLPWNIGQPSYSQKARHGSTLYSVSMISPPPPPDQGRGSFQSTVSSTLVSCPPLWRILRSSGLRYMKRVPSLLHAVLCTYFALHGGSMSLLTTNCALSVLVFLCFTGILIIITLTRKCHAWVCCVCADCYVFQKLFTTLYNCYNC